MRRAGRMSGERKHSPESEAADVRPPSDATGHAGREQFGGALEQLQQEPDHGKQMTLPGEDHHAHGGDAAIPLKARGQGFGPTGEVAR